MGGHFLADAAARYLFDAYEFVGNQIANAAALQRNLWTNGAQRCQWVAAGFRGIISRQFVSRCRSGVQGRIGTGRRRVSEGDAASLSYRAVFVLAMLLPMLAASADRPLHAFSVAVSSLVLPSNL